MEIIECIKVLLKVDSQEAVTRGCNSAVMVGWHTDFFTMTLKNRVHCEENSILIYKIVKLLLKGYSVNCCVIGEAWIVVDVCC